LPLERIAAIQICSGTIKKAENPYETFEMNLLLSHPPGKRLSSSATPTRKRCVTMPNDWPSS